MFTVSSDLDEAQLDSNTTTVCSLLLHMKALSIKIRSGLASVGLLLQLTWSQARTLEVKGLIDTALQATLHWLPRQGLQVQDRLESQNEK